MKIGEVVRLSSGSPAMTVASVSPKEEVKGVRCQWFQDGILYEGWFSADMLKNSAAGGAL